MDDGGRTLSGAGSYARPPSILDALVDSMYFALATLVLASVTQCLASRNHEENYSEKLTLRPLRDGKVAASFGFTTSLYNAVPRTPDSLNQDDERAYI